MESIRQKWCLTYLERLVAVYMVYFYASRCADPLISTSKVLAYFWRFMPTMESLPPGITVAIIQIFYFERLLKVLLRKAQECRPIVGHSVHPA
jgi:hypothetical protein